MAEIRESEWFDEFWEATESTIDVGLEDEETGPAALRLIAEWIDAGLVGRDGDSIVGRHGDTLPLSTFDAHLIRRIEDAVQLAGDRTKERNDG